MPADEPNHPSLRVEPRHAPFLREHFESGRAGSLEALAEHPDQLHDPDRIKAYAETYGRIIDGIDRREIVADPEVRAALTEAAAVNDEANDYERIVREHEAFVHLLRQLGAGEGDAEGDEPDARPPTAPAS